MRKMVRAIPEIDFWVSVLSHAKNHSSWLRTIPGRRGQALLKDGA